MKEEKEWEKFNKEFEKENKLLIQIIAIYIYSERQMDILIKRNCKNPNSFPKLNFPSKAEFLFSMGIINESLKNNITKLSKIRNRFAHYADASFNDFGDKELVLLHIQNKNIQKDLRKLDTDEERVIGLYFLVLLPLFTITHDTGISVGHTKPQ